MKILIIKNDGIGDLILTSGIIASIAAQPGYEVDLVTCEASKEIATQIPGLHSVSYVSRDQISFLNIGDADKQVLQRLLKIKYDKAIVLRRFIRQSTFVIMNYVHAKEKFCFWQYPSNVSTAVAEEESMGWTHIQGNERTLHELEYYRDVLQNVFEFDLSLKPSLGFSVDPNQIQRNEKSIGMILSGASSRWPMENWKRLILQIIADNWTVSLFGGPEDRPFAEEMKKNIGGVRAFAGKLTFEQSVDELSNQSIVVGNDTGLTHLAGMYSQTLLVIQGGGTFGRFFPWPETIHDQYLVYRPMKCFDCDWRCKLDVRECIELITVEDVYGAIRRIENKSQIEKNIVLGPWAGAYQLAWKRGGGIQNGLRSTITIDCTH